MRRNLPSKYKTCVIQCWTNGEDVGPTLYKWYTNVLCLLGINIQRNINLKTNICNVDIFIISDPMVIW